jgi:hypothetical protein
MVRFSAGKVLMPLGISMPEPLEPPEPLQTGGLASDAIPQMGEREGNLIRCSAAGERQIFLGDTFLPRIVTR